MLLRSVVLLEGKEAARKWRGSAGKPADGPGKLCKAFRIDLDLNGWDLTSGRLLWIEEYRRVTEDHVQRTPRVGVGYAVPEDREALLRFLIRASLH